MSNGLSGGSNVEECFLCSDVLGEIWLPGTTNRQSSRYNALGQCPRQSGECVQNLEFGMDLTYSIEPKFNVRDARCNGGGEDVPQNAT